MQDTDSLKPIARIVAVGISVLLGAVPDARAVLATDQGIVFRCNPASAGPVLDGVLGYLQGLGISPGLLKVSRDGSSSDFSVSLAGADPSAGTLDLIDRKDIDVREELVVLPAMKRNATRTVLTVSKKEIALALLTPGRATVFEGAACSVEAIVDHVGVRQNIVSWAELLDWRWPNGGVATWNTKYWKKGSLRKDALLDPALRDAFSNQSKYGIGCYTASKMVVVQGVLDYYARVKNDPKTAALVRARLLTDGEPLVHVEPGAMWSFEADAEPADL